MNPPRDVRAPIGVVDEGLCPLGGTRQSKVAEPQASACAPLPEPHNTCASLDTPPPILTTVKAKTQALLPFTRRALSNFKIPRLPALSLRGLASLKLPCIKVAVPEITLPSLPSALRGLRRPWSTSANARRSFEDPSQLITHHGSLEYDEETIHAMLAMYEKMEGLGMMEQGRELERQGTGGSAPARLGSEVRVSGSEAGNMNVSELQSTGGEKSVNWSRTGHAEGHVQIAEEATTRQAESSCVSANYACRRREYVSVLRARYEGHMRPHNLGGNPTRHPDIEHRETDVERYKAWYREVQKGRREAEHTLLVGAAAASLAARKMGVVAASVVD